MAGTVETQDQTGTESSNEAGAHNEPPDCADAKYMCSFQPNQKLPRQSQSADVKDHLGSSQFSGLKFSQHIFRKAYARKQSTDE